MAHDISSLPGIIRSGQYQDLSKVQAPAAGACAGLGLFPGVEVLAAPAPENYEHML